MFVTPISGQMSRPSAALTGNWGSVPGRTKPKTVKIGINSLTFSNKKDTEKPPPYEMGRWPFSLEDCKDHFAVKSSD